jgi:putative tricarboxylic transport membrane protein
MELFFASLIQSVHMAADLTLLLVIFAGVLWGCAAGALPGVTSVIAIGVMVPFTFGMPPIYAVAFLVAINVGVSYGNSIPAILVGLPGTPSAVLTALDGYALHKQGKSGLALGITHFASVSGQFLSIFLFLLMVVPLAQLTYVFLSPELFALYFLGTTAIISLTSRNILKGLVAAAFGLTIATVGRDPLSAVTRFDLGLVELRAGIEIVPVVIGLLAVSELFRSMRHSFRWDALSTSFSARYPGLGDLRRATPPVLLGTTVGSVIGAIPGLGGSAAAVMAYQQARLLSRHPEEFGRGSTEGIAANEAAQNAAQAGEMVPTFGLGIPGSGAMVVLLGALLMHGFIPGPLLIIEAPELLYASVTGLLVATIMLVVIGWSIARLLLRLVTFDRSLVLVGALVLTMVGTYSIDRSVFDVFLLLLFGVIGYFMLRYGYSTAGAAIAVVLGEGLETNLRAGLLLMEGDALAFLSRPWTAGILGFAILLLIYGSVNTLRLSRQEAAERERALAAHLARNGQQSP